MSSNFEYSVFQWYSKTQNRFFACILELPGCISEGDTADVALENVHSAGKLWLQRAKDNGVAIPSFSDPVC